MLNDHQRQQLIQYRIDSAKQAADDASLLLNHQRYRAAVNRIYYTMFYMLTPLALKYQFETSKHKQLIGWFNREFVKTGKLPVKYSKYIQKAYKNRNMGDYEDMMEFFRGLLSMLRI